MQGPCSSLRRGLVHHYASAMRICTQGYRNAGAMLMNTQRPCTLLRRGHAHYNEGAMSISTQGPFVLVRRGHAHKYAGAQERRGHAHEYAGAMDIIT